MIHHWNKAVGDKGDSMAVYGYIRVSARDQNEDRQLVAMHNVKVPKRNIYLDKQSGKDFERPMYRKLVQKLQKDVTRALKDEILLTPHVKLVPKGSLPVSEGKAVRVVDKRTVYQ